LICNTTGTLNQYFLWAGEFASTFGVLGVYDFLKADLYYSNQTASGTSQNSALALTQQWLGGTANGGPGLSSSQVSTIMTYLESGKSSAASPAPVSYTHLDVYKRQR